MVVRSDWLAGQLILAAGIWKERGEEMEKGMGGANGYFVTTKPEIDIEKVQRLPDKGHRHGTSDGRNGTEQEFGKKEFGNWNFYSVFLSFRLLTNQSQRWDGIGMWAT